MDIKKEIQHFRSQALMGRYQNAIRLGNNLIDKLGMFEKILDQDFTLIKQEIEEELNYCVQLNIFMQGSKKNQQSQPMSKIVQQAKIQNLSKTSQGKKWKSSSIHELKNQSQVVQKVIEFEEIQLKYEDNLTIEQRIHKHMILPLNMPVFKLKSSIFVVKTHKCFNEVLEYLVHYDFKQFPSVDLCDLGVQNIVHCKEDMQSMGQKRVVIALRKQKNEVNAFSKKQIDKLKNIVQVYRQTYESGKVSKKFVLAFVVEEAINLNLSQKSSFLNNNEEKKIYFE